MDYLNLGKSGLKVSRLCLGTMTFGAAADEATSLRIVQRALDAGINFIDTANIYSEGRAEEIVGKAVRGKRDQVVIATKVRLGTGRGPNDEGLSRVHIMRAVEDSLRRLGTDYIDLYQAHWPDPSTPLEETLRAFDDLVHQGKVRYVGVSNYEAWRLCKALWTCERYGLAPVVSVQPRYNMLDRDIERELLPFCREEGIGVIPYSPLAEGVLTGKYRPDEPLPAGTRLGDDPNAAQRYAGKLAIAAQLQALAGELGVTLAQLAIAWLLHQPGITSPIIGARTPEQLDEPLKGLEVRLGAEVLRRIDAITPR